MCGVAGILIVPGGTSSRDSVFLKRKVNSALELLKSRGPDGGGLWVNDQQNVCLGHRRLSILDLSEHGRQPYIAQSGRFVLVFNGEIYNHLRLRRILESQYGFADWRGSSDSETLITCVDFLGIEKTLALAEGMFAFGVWDSESKKLFLARDRFGEKPLFYTQDSSRSLYFASTLDSLTAMIGGTPVLNESSINEYFRFGFFSRPNTVYANTFSLMPGEVLTVDEHGQISKGQYWCSVTQATQAPIFKGSYSDAIEELTSLLSKSVNEQLVADVPVAAFLSGGVDSSLVVSQMSMSGAAKVNTFTVGFEDKNYDESIYAKRIAEIFGANHTEVMLGSNELLKIIPKLGSVFDEPFADESQAPTALISQYIAKRYKVALSGDGGDELFGGYNRHQFVGKLMGLSGYIPSKIKSAVSNVGGACLSKYDSRLRSFLNKQNIDRARKVLGALNSSDELEFYFSLLSRRGFGERSAHVYCPPNSYFTGQVYEGGPESRFMALDTVFYLPNDVLVKTDRASMASSIEVRAPFLNKELFSFAWSLPVDWKLRGGKGKMILKSVLARYLPDELISKPKMGFSIPLAEWLRSDLKAWSLSLVNDAIPYEAFPAEYVRRLLTDHLNSSRDNARELWPYLMFLSWSRGRL